MAIETLGEALSYGWRVTARCAHGKRDGMKSIKECVYRAELDMETLVWTRGRSFPLSRLETRLRCPMCGSRDVRLIFTRAARSADGSWRKGATEVKASRLGEPAPSGPIEPACVPSR